jgi:hypothetical protein
LDTLSLSRGDAQWFLCGPFKEMDISALIPWLHLAPPPPILEIIKYLILP